MKPHLSICYHRRPIPSKGRDHRVVCIDRMEFGESLGADWVMPPGKTLTFAVRPLTSLGTKGKAIAAEWKI